MKSKPPPACQSKQAPTEKQLQAIRLGAESLLLRLGATPAEVALLRQLGSDHHGAAMAIAAMKIRTEGDAAA
ncbi:hypothetical protein [Rhodoferax antarcticus]|uniref:hypothetical protein n=1 Tax=Rhodoferax antarcticus TaxID=81479 RepID=UPI002224A099|nr:hypothetical protein [Rhodoferax antarcticus]MCW2314325.1 hypothetical protein [Rhodoferax antarcticus]